jgi:hypothetical protein
MRTGLVGQASCAWVADAQNKDVMEHSRSAIVLVIVMPALLPGALYWREPGIQSGAPAKHL